MKITNNLKGTRGFVIAYERLLRFKYMISEQAKSRVKILAFWERHGTEATNEAFGVSKRTLYRWQSVLKGGNGKLEALNPTSTAPKRRRSRQTEVWVRDKIISLRTDHPRLGKEKLHALLKQDGYTGSVSTVGRILSDLKQRGLLPNKVKVSLSGKTGRIIERKPKKNKAKLRRPQSVRVLQLDTVVRFIDGTKRYLLTAVDTETRTAFAGIYTNHGSQSASDFLKKCLVVLPDCPTQIQTDNGSEFAKYFADTAKRLNLVHYHTYPRCPKMNGNVERFNRTLQEEWIVYHRSVLRDDVLAANEQLVDYLLWYNSRRPHHSLGLKSPFQGIVERLRESECHMWWTSTFN
ncbi:MAG: transposase [Gammaproteobacteria bacterium]|nr:transposase [Gammaproteobacteria bacterium]